MSNITYHESPVFDVANHLLQMGYKIGNYEGSLVEKFDLKSIGILQPMPPVLKSFLMFSWRRKRRCHHIGTLYFDNLQFGAEYDCRWVLHVFGRSKIEELLSALKDQVYKKNVDLKVELKSENPKEETHWSDRFSLY